MKLLSFQPFSLFRNGGGSRVLRRLYQGHENQILSLVSQDSHAKLNTGDIKEKIAYVHPVLRGWMRWKTRNLNNWLQSKVFYNINTKNIQKIASDIDCDTVHIVSHGIFALALNKDIFIDNKELWVSFHDYYSTSGMTFEGTSHLWNIANRRLVISPELGYKYQELFGAKEFELITDGVGKEEVSIPKNINPSDIKIYFAGLLHIDYLPLFNILAQALDQLTKEGLSFTVILRGTQRVDFFKNRLFQVEYRDDYISDKEVKAELDSADILYLPIKFSDPFFYLYSLSTKMVSYLGGAGSILYHGPDDSATRNLLYENDSAICCTSLEVRDMMKAIGDSITKGQAISSNAKNLSLTKFNLKEIQQRFWRLNTN